MSDLDYLTVVGLYTKIDRMSKQVLGSQLPAPLMTLSFLLLLVIPELKLSDLGLFCGKEFKFISVHVRD